MLSWIVHYKNKFPGCWIDQGPRHLKVIHEGQLVVHIEKNGADMWQDMSADYALDQRHDLEPIPRDSRVWKLTLENKIEKDELSDQREVIGIALCKKFGKVPSIPELKVMLDPKLSQLLLSDKSEDKLKIENFKRGNTDHKWEFAPALKNASLVAPELVNLLEEPEIAVSPQDEEKAPDS